MKHTLADRRRMLMIAYTYYESDTRVIREAEAAVDGGFDVDFLALRRPGSRREQMIRGVRVIRLNQAKYRGRRRLKYLLAYVQFFLRCLVATSALFVRRRYCIVHVNNMPDFLVFSTVLARLCGAKIILDIHDPMPNTFASKFKGREAGLYFRLLLWQERLSAKFCNRVITVHEPVKQGILVKHGLDPDRIDVIANFADESIFWPRPCYNIGDNIRFVFHGTILERAGLRTVLEALLQVRNRRRMSLLIVGEGDFARDLQRLIAELGLTDIVDFDNRSYPAHMIVDRLSESNVGLVPLQLSSATNHALPLKLMEYIGLGLPVISVRNAAIAYYLTPEDCLFFDWRSASSLAQVMDRLVDEPALLQIYRDRSLALRCRFGWAPEKQRYIELLRGLINDPQESYVGQFV